MEALIGLLGLFGFFVCLISLVVQAIRKKRKRVPVIGLVLCLVMFIGALSIDSDDENQSDSVETRRPSFSASESNSRTRSAQIADTEETILPVRASEPTTAPTQQPTPTPKTASEPMSAPTPLPPATPDPTPEPAANTTSLQPISSGRSGNSGNFHLYNDPSKHQTEDSYVLNTRSKKIHSPSCPSVADIKPENYATTNESIGTLLEKGYSLCGKKDEPWN